MYKSFNLQRFTATQQIIKCSQNECFEKEILMINKKVELPKISKLLQLDPTIDDSGILRVGGRLTNASIPFESKHPIILDPKHYL